MDQRYDCASGDGSFLHIRASRGEGLRVCLRSAGDVPVINAKLAQEMLTWIGGTRDVSMPRVFGRPRLMRSSGGRIAFADTAVFIGPRDIPRLVAQLESIATPVVTAGPFKVGDMVTPTDGEAAGNFLTIGKAYRVNAVRHDGRIMIDDDTGRAPIYWPAPYFKPAQPATPAHPFKAGDMVVLAPREKRIDMTPGKAYEVTDAYFSNSSHTPRVRVLDDVGDDRTILATAVLPAPTAPTPLTITCIHASSDKLRAWIEAGCLVVEVERGRLSRKARVLLDKAKARTVLEALRGGREASLWCSGQEVAVESNLGFCLLHIVNTGAVHIRRDTPGLAALCSLIEGFVGAATIEVGDVVRCVDSGGFAEGLLTHGKIYTVLRVHDIQPGVKELAVRADDTVQYSLDHSRFVFHSRGTPAPAPTPAATPERLEELRQDAEKLRKAADTLICGFAWDATPEGHDYWSGVHAKLEGIRDRAYEALRAAETPKPASALSPAQRAHCATVAKAIDGLYWHGALRGYAYWATAFDKLVVMAGDAMGARAAHYPATKESLTAAAAALAIAFTWRRTPEGHAYWSDVNASLHNEASHITQPCATPGVHYAHAAE